MGKMKVIGGLVRVVWAIFGEKKALDWSKIKKSWVGIKEVEPLNIDTILKTLFEKWEGRNSVVLIKGHRANLEFLKIAGQWFSKLFFFCFRMPLYIVIDIYYIRN